MNIDDKLYLGVDPGRDKTGVALVRAGADGKPQLLRESILPTEHFVEHLQNFLGDTAISAIVIGDGTTSQTMQQQLERAFPQLPFHRVNEYNTTQEAKQLYWKLHPPTGWKKWLPTALLEPPSPVDGLAAAVQVFRYVCGKEEKSS